MKYVAVAALTLPAGSVLGLNESQFKARKHALKPAGKKGVYTCTEAVQFKAGEEFHFDGELSKAQASGVMTDADRARAEKAKAREGEAAEKARQAQEAEQAAAVLAAARLGAQAASDWANSEGLRKQHGNDFDAYLQMVLKPA